MKKRTDINKMITQRLIERIQTTKTLPWKKPWASPELLPRNLISKKNYRGINTFLLHAMGYESPFWLTMRQANSLGGKVRKGEHSTPVIFWKFFEPDEGKEQPSDQPAKSYAMLRYYRVFNATQCDGLKVENGPSTATESISDHSTATDVIRSMPHPPTILYGFRQACYIPAIDRIHMPIQDSFTSADGFYATLFHELSHSTGHPSRLARKGIVDTKAFGSHSYSLEELTAEICAGFLCGRCGILAKVEENSAAYLQHWLKQLEAEPSMLIKAGSQAQKAFDYITNEKKEEFVATESKSAPCEGVLS